MQPSLRALVLARGHRPSHSCLGQRGHSPWTCSTVARAPGLVHSEMPSSGVPGGCRSAFFGSRMLGRGVKPRTRSAYEASALCLCVHHLRMFRGVPAPHVFSLFSFVHMKPPWAGALRQ